MSPHLALYFLGSPQLYLDHEPIPMERRKVVALLAYLALERGQHRRETLSALLWPDYDQSKAFTNLRPTLWEIQQSIGEGWLVTDHEKTGLNEHADIWLDVEQFESMFAQSQMQNDAPLRIPLLVEAAKLYRNHFLTGLSLKDAPNFNEWAFAKSEDLHCQLAGVLTRLSEDYCALGQAEKAIPYARRLITLDPLNESAHRHLMNIYVQAGQHSAALKQYQICEEILRRELNLDPQPETYALYKQIRKRELKPVQVVKPPEPVSPRHNLPRQLSSFIGREKEQKQIADLIANYRLITLTGVGGIGKTRLSIQTASTLLNDFPDGIWLVELAPLSDPTLVPQLVVTALGLIEQSDRSHMDILTDFLQAKRVLLILDNCEHLIQACAELAETLLHVCPDLHILATSRESLNISGEMAYLVPTLTIRDPLHIMLKTLSQYEALQLFVERAQMTMPDFSITPDNVFAIAQICHQLDGIPLALELAAARIKVLSVQQIADRLDHTLQLLTRGERTAPQRHQTLRAALDWSYDLLSKKEQFLFQRLSVFAGGFTLEAVESICVSNDIEADEILCLLTYLVEKSLLVKQELDAEARYRFLEPVRQYAYERLLVSNEAEQIRNRYFEFFLKLSEEAEQKLSGAEEIQWLNKLAIETHNVRAALEWSIDNNVEAGLRLAAALYRFWLVRTFYKEGRVWLTRLLVLHKVSSPSLIRAKALNVAGYLAWYQSDMKKASSLLTESLIMYKNLKHEDGVAASLCGLGWIARIQHDYDAARRFYEESLTIRRELGDRQGIADTLLSMGFLLYHQGDLMGAHSLLEESLLIWQEVENMSGIAPTLSYLGRVSEAQGNYEQAATLYRKSLDLFQKLGDKYGCIYTLHYLGHMAHIQADYTKARSIYQESLGLSREVGPNWYMAISLTKLGHLALTENNYAEARIQYSEGLRILSKSGDRQDLINCLVGLANLARFTGKMEHATTICGFVEVLLQTITGRLVAPEQEIYQQMVTDLHSQLGEETFAKALAEGQAMTLDEGVKYPINVIQGD